MTCCISMRMTAPVPQQKYVSGLDYCVPSSRCLRFRNHTMYARHSLRWSNDTTTDLWQCVDRCSAFTPGISQKWSQWMAYITQ
jgi:hypothetical protein